MLFLWIGLDLDLIKKRILEILEILEDCVVVVIEGVFLVFKK